MALTTPHPMTAPLSTLSPYDGPTTVSPVNMEHAVESPMTTIRSGGVSLCWTFGGHPPSY